MLRNTFKIGKCGLAVVSPGGLDTTITMVIMSGLKHSPELCCLIQNQAEPNILDLLQIEKLVDCRIMYSTIYCGYQN